MSKRVSLKATGLLNSMFILVCLVTACSSPAQLNPLSPQATILAFGDSLTYGTGTSRDKAYPAILEQLTGRTVVNAGIPGEVTAQGLRRLPDLIRRHEPDLIIICHGGNDILRKLDPVQTRRNLQAMIDLSIANHAQVLLVGVPEFGLFLRSAPFYEALADSNELPIENEALGDILASNQLKSDHIHPNTQGYQQLANRIAQLMHSSGAL